MLSLIHRPSSHFVQTHEHSAHLIVVGCSALDITAQCADEGQESLLTGSTVPGKLTLTAGGVARNIAEASHRLLPPSFSSLLVSPVGKDQFGHILEQQSKAIGMRTDGLITSDNRTAVCNLMIDSRGNLISGVADMDIVTQTEGPILVRKIVAHNPAIVALDANLSVQAITEVIALCQERGIPVFYEPTSVAKAAAFIPAIANRDVVIDFTSPNILELRRMYQVAKDVLDPIDNLASNQQLSDDLSQLAQLPITENDYSKGTLAFLLKDGISQMALGLLSFFRHLIIKCGGRGVLLVSRMQDSKEWQSMPSLRQVVTLGRDGRCLVVRHFPPLPVEKHCNDTGAGDTFVGAILAGLVVNPEVLNEPASSKVLLDRAQKAAILTLASPFSVSRELAELNKSKGHCSGPTLTK